MDGFEFLDAGTRALMERDPRVKAQVALLARMIAALGLVTITRHTCPFCQEPGAMAVDLRAGGHGRCSRCDKRAPLRDLLADRTEREEIGRMMRTRPRTR